MTSQSDTLPRRAAIAVFLAFALAYFISALLRAVTATLSPVLTDEFSLHARDLGLLAGGYFLGFAAVQLPLGAWLAAAVLIAGVALWLQPAAPQGTLYESKSRCFYIPGSAMPLALILGWGGLPTLGIQSAAYAGLVGNVLAMLFLVLRLRHKKHVMAPDRELWAALRLNREILGKVLRIGLPTGVQMVVLSLSELVILALVNSHGSQATAAYGAVTQIVNYVQFPALSIAITASILGAQAIGAGRLERIGPILRTGLVINLCLTGGLIVLGYGLSHWLLGLFITDDSARVRAEHLLHIMLWSILVFGFQAVIGGIMRASGVVLMPVAISIFCVLGVELPMAYLFNAHFGLEGVWMAFPVTYLAMLVLQIAYYRLVWRHKQIKRLV